MNSKTIWASVILILIACASTIFMIHTQFKSISLPKPHLDKSQNMFMKDVLFRQYDENGNLQTQMRASLMRHYAYQDMSYFENPIIHIQSQSGVSWKITADYAKTLHGKTIVDLWGDVIVLRPKQGTTTKLTILTSALTYFPKRSFAQSDRLVTILQPGSRMSGKGMTANLKIGVVTSLSQSKEVYTPDTTDAITKR